MKIEFIHYFFSGINHSDEIFTSSSNFILVSMLTEIIQPLNQNNFSKLGQQFL